VRWLNVGLSSTNKNQKLLKEKTKKFQIVRVSLDGSIHRLTKFIKLKEKYLLQKREKSSSLLNRKFRQSQHNNNSCPWKGHSGGFSKSQTSSKKPKTGFLNTLKRLWILCRNFWGVQCQSDNHFSFLLFLRGTFVNNVFKWVNHKIEKCHQFEVM
jgi:hypothetical protein